MFLICVYGFGTCDRWHLTAFSVWINNNNKMKIFRRRSDMARVTTKAPYNVRCSYSGNGWLVAITSRHSPAFKKLIRYPTDTGVTKRHDKNKRRTATSIFSEVVRRRSRITISDRICLGCGWLVRSSARKTRLLVGAMIERRAGSTRGGKGDRQVQF